MAIFVGEPTLMGEERIGKPRAEAEDEAAAADHMIGNRRLDGRVDRVREVDELHRGAHADLFGQPRRLAHQELGDRQGVDLVDIDRFPMMFADIGVTKAELIGENDLAEVFLVGPGRAGVRAKAVREDAEFHYHSSVSTDPAQEGHPRRRGFASSRPQQVLRRVSRHRDGRETI